MTNVRFSHDFHRVISVGGGDHAVFQWRFLPEGVSGDDEDLPEPVSGYLESDSEESDSEASDIGELDSDVENVSVLVLLTNQCCSPVLVGYNNIFHVSFKNNRDFQGGGSGSG